MNQVQTCAVIALVGLLAVAVMLFFRLSEGSTPVSGAIAEARSGKIEFNAVEKKAQDLGMTCPSDGKEACAEMVTRAEQNPLLKSAFLKAKASEVWIIPSGKFFVGAGWVDIDPKANDEKIAAFLE